MTMIPIKSRKRRKNNVQKHVKKPFFGVSFRFNGSRNRPSYVGRPQSPMKQIGAGLGVKMFLVFGGSPEVTEYCKT